MTSYEKVIVVDVFHQNYTQEDGIPPHWCCKFYRGGFVDYAYFATKEEAYTFAWENGYCQYH